MRATVEAQAFYEAMKKLSEVPRKSSIPALENICVYFSNGACTLMATDLETWMIAKLPASGDDFSFVFQNSANVIRACRYYEGRLELELCGKDGDLRLTMRSNGKYGEFPVSSSEMFPEAPSTTPKQRYQSSAKDLYRRSRCVKYAAAASQDKPSLAGIRFEDHRMWCMNGCRAAVNRDEALRVERPFIVPANALALLRTLGDADVEICVGERYISFSAGIYTIHSRLLEETRYYELDTAWPQTCKENYSVDRREFLDAIKYLSEFAGKVRAPAVFDSGRISLRGSDSHFSAQISVDGTCDILYGFNLDYMKEALEQLADSDVIRIGVTSSISPIVLIGEQNNSALVLPVRLKAQPLRKAA